MGVVRYIYCGVLLSGIVGCRTDLAELRIDSVSPTRVLVNQDQLLTITGDFSVMPVVSYDDHRVDRIKTGFFATLDGVPLDAVTLTAPDVLSATLPATLALGSHDLLVTAADGRRVRHPSAVEVVQCLAPMDCINRCHSVTAVSCLPDGSCQRYDADLDADSDGAVARSCAGGDDCDDGDPLTWPGATEVCDLVDNDCNPATPDGNSDALFGTLCDRGDGDPCANDIWRCDGGSWDCVDGGTDVPEICDGADNDCDGLTDEDAC